MKKIIILIVSLILFSISVILHVYSKNYTKIYFVYKDVKSLETIDEVKDYLKTNGIEYVIYNNKLTLKSSDMIFFDVYNDKCIIVKNDVMDAFETLDNKDYSLIRTEGIKVNGKILEKHSISKNNMIYIKYKDQYFAQNTLINYALPTIFLILGIAVLIGDIAMWSVNTKKEKLQEKTVDET